MLASCDATSSRGGIGTIRSVCLLVVTVGLVILFVLSYVDRYEAEICARKELTLRAHEERRLEANDVKRRLSLSSADGFGGGDDDNDGNFETQPASAAERKNRSASSSSSVWDYDWDAYVHVFRMICKVAIIA